jgi:hypothetical protein
VIAGFLDPFSPASIHVSRSVSTSQPYLSPFERLLPNAIVRVRAEDQDFITLQYDKDFDDFIDASGKLKLVSGKTYYLEEEHPGYPSVLASCTIPAVAPDLDEISTHFFEKKFSDQEP